MVSKYSWSNHATLSESAPSAAEEDGWTFRAVVKSGSDVGRIQDSWRWPAKISSDDSSSKTLSLTCSKKLLSWWNCLFRTFRVCSLLELLVWVSGLLQDHFRMANFICQVSLADDSLFFCTLSFLPKKRQLATFTVKIFQSQYFNSILSPEGGCWWNCLRTMSNC